MDYDYDIPPVSGIRGRLDPNQLPGRAKSTRKRDAKARGNRRVRAAIRRALKDGTDVKVRGLTVWDID